MSIEGPTSIALISRLPHPEVGAAAFNIMMGLALWIESPVIDLLSTSTTLCRSLQNYRELSRFVWALLAVVTLAHAAIVFTPLYGLATEGVLGVSREVAAAARPGLALMLPWSALIGWRRYLQGILIRNDRTKVIGLGTSIRVVGMFGSALGLFFATRMTGVEIAGLSIVLGVGMETAFTHWASRETIRIHLSREDGAPPITQNKLRRFHLPLTATTMVMMLGTPVISAALARAPSPTLQLAGYQVAMTLVWLMRTTTYALPEIVIALYRNPQTARALRGFCLWVGGIASGVMALVWITGFDLYFFRVVLGATPDEVAVAHLAFVAPLLVPFLGACQGYARGMLTAHHFTVSRLLAVGGSMSTLLICLAGTVLLGVNGVVSVGLCLTISFTAELAILLGFWRKLAPREEILVPDAADGTGAEAMQSNA